MPDATRDALIRKWVDHQFPGQSVSIQPASADASFRRYFRLTLDDARTFILMDAPPDKENSKPFVRVAGLIEAAGLCGPKVLAQDLAQGFLLLTDLGRVGYLAALQAEPALADVLMRPVLDVLVQWQLSSKPEVLPAYDAALLRREMDLFPEWFVGKHLGAVLSDEEKSALENIFSLLIASASAQPKVFVHRDFMPRNLMVVESEQVLTPGVLDFQDAVSGPITYDVVSLFRDAFISWDEEQEIDWVVRYWEKARSAGLPVHTDFGDFWQAYEWMGLQRHLKVLGIFCRLNYRDGKSSYLNDLPRFIHYIRKTADRYIAFKPLNLLLDRLENKTADVRFTF
jgi:N-acetylmuramate 1-kinase